MRSWSCHWEYFLFLLWVFLSFGAWRVTAGASSSESDLYQLLGVKRTATVKEIKQAYRKKVLDTHPDKNKNVPPDQAAEAFRQVVHAFEILSDETSRKRYDRTGRTTDAADPYGGGNRGGGYNNNHNHQQFQWTWSYRYRPQKLKDRFEVQQAQSRVLHVVSLSQLQTIMLDDNDLLERNLLVCITTPKTDAVADDEMVFPYPFAAMSSQGIWWEDLLQTVRIKFYRKSELSELFGVTAEQVHQKPIFLFGQRGTRLTADTAQHLPRYHGNNRQDFEAWVWKQIEIVVEFTNRHEHRVEVYWIHGSTAHRKFELEPGESQAHTTMLSHEWYVRDVRVDTRPDSPGRYKLTNDSSLGSWKIINDESPQPIIIPGGQCFDFSGHCGFWKSYGECHKNPVFMREQCIKTCGWCPPKENNNKNHRHRDEF